MANTVNEIHAVATLTKANGKVFVRHPDGTQSILKVGAQLNVGDVVVASPNAHAEIQIADGQLIKIGGTTADALTIDNSILGSASDHQDVKADSVTDFNKVLENLAKGGDITDDLDPTAAGTTGGGDLMSGNVYVVLDRIVTTTTPSPFENTNSIGPHIEPTMFSLLLAQITAVVPPAPEVPNIVLALSGGVVGETVDKGTGNGGVADDEKGASFTLTVDKVSTHDVFVTIEVHETGGNVFFDITIPANSPSATFNVNDYLPKELHGIAQEVTVVGVSGGDYPSYSTTGDYSYIVENDAAALTVTAVQSGSEATLTAGANVDDDSNTITYTLKLGTDATSTAHGVELIVTYTIGTDPTLHFASVAADGSGTISVPLTDEVSGTTPVVTVLSIHDYTGTDGGTPTSANVGTTEYDLSIVGLTAGSGEAAGTYTLPTYNVINDAVTLTVTATDTASDNLTTAGNAVDDDSNTITYTLALGSTAGTTAAGHELIVTYTIGTDPTLHFASVAADGSGTISVPLTDEVSGTTPVVTVLSIHDFVVNGSGPLSSANVGKTEYDLTIAGATAGVVAGTYTLPTYNEINDAHSATISINAIDTNNNINNFEAQATNTNITGTVGGNVQANDTVTLTIDGHTYTGLVSSGKTFSISVPTSILLADSNVHASVTTSIDDIATGAADQTYTSDFIIVGSADDDAKNTTDAHTSDPTMNNPGSIIGGHGNDILIGDTGGSTLVPGQTANIAFVLDVSGSMSQQITFNNTTESKILALQQSVVAELTHLRDTGAHVTVNLEAFSTTAFAVGGGTGTFQLWDPTQFQHAIDAVNALKPLDTTNYQAGLVGTLDWISSLAPATISTAAINKVVFISDGEPNAYGSGTSSSAQVAISNALTTVASINSDKFTVQAIGVNVDPSLTSSSPLGYLSELQGYNFAIPATQTPAHTALNATSASELYNAIGELVGGSGSLAAAGNDTIVAGVGNNIIFGDSVNTDALAVALGLGTPAGFGYGVFQMLEANTDPKVIAAATQIGGIDHHFGTPWTAQDTYNYIQANATALSLESGRTGGNDTIDASATGNNIIFGQEGKDTITVGVGTDSISGGSGTDTFIFNSGASQAVVAGTLSGATLSGFDVIQDYNTGAATTELLNLPGNVHLAAQGTGFNGLVDSTAYGVTIGSHTIAAGGVISFFTSENGTGTALTISNGNGTLASALDYLTHNDIGGTGATVVFQVGADSFVYSQATAGSVGTPATYTLVDLHAFGAVDTTLTTTTSDSNLHHILIG